LRPLFNAALLLLVFLSGALHGCADEDSAEGQVRRAIEAAELAAEARDASDLADLMSPHFREAHGLDREAVERYLRGYFLAHPSVHLLTRVEAIEFPAPDQARAQVTVGLVGLDSDSNLDVAAKLYRFDLQFDREDDDWRVSYADVR
jgi:hypothetical protein